MTKTILYIAASSDGYIDEYIITVVPRELHEGIALPIPLLTGNNFQLTNTIKFSSDIVQHHYRNN